MTLVHRVLIVGASAAGLATLEGLRARGFDDSVTVMGEEAEYPYDRPPLSKQFMSGAWEAERTRLRTPEALASLQAEWMLGTRACGLDAKARTVTTDQGCELPYDSLVIATGLTPRKPRGLAGLDGVHTLKTIHDATRLRAALVRGARVVVVGAGPLGSEFAATAAEHGCEVTLVDPHRTPLQRQIGQDMGRLIGRLHERHGVRLRMESSVERFLGAPTVNGVRLADGSKVEADLVLVAIGSTPATEWLQGSRIPLDDGVACDATCQAIPGVFAAGDVARWHHPLYGPLRIEHRMNATEQGMAVAAGIIGQPRPFAPTPYFWTDHYDTTIQMRGRLGPRYKIVDRLPEERGFVALLGDNHSVTGVLNWNDPRGARRFQSRVGQAWPEADERGH